MEDWQMRITYGMPWMLQRSDQGTKRERREGGGDQPPLHGQKEREKTSRAPLTTSHRPAELTVFWNTMSTISPTLKLNGVLVTLDSWYDTLLIVQRTVPSFKNI